MSTDTTQITIILDRTGSMQAIRDDTIGGFNAFLAEQKAHPAPATLTLVRFDSQDPYEVIHDTKPLAEVPELTRETFVPRAMTPLLDALGRGINELEARLARMPTTERPARTVFVIVTDGHENASREFSRDQIRQMIRTRQDADGWQFVFLSADLDAIDEAVSLGMHRRSTLAFDKTPDGTRDAWRASSEVLSAYRTVSSAAKVGFSDEHREQQGRRVNGWTGSTLTTDSGIGSRNTTVGSNIRFRWAAYLEPDALPRAACSGARRQVAGTTKQRPGKVPAAIRRIPRSRDSSRIDMSGPMG